MKKLTSCLLGLMVVCAGSSAWAQERLGRAGQVAIAAERLFGLTHSTQTTEDEETVGGMTFTSKTTTSTTDFSLLGPGRVQLLASVFQSPRAGLDFFVTDGLSLGGSFTFFTTSLERETENEIDGVPTDPGGDNTSEVDYTGFGFFPRIGYAVMFNDTVGIWPRLGISYVHLSSKDDDDDESSTSLTAISGEAPLVISPVPHAAFLIGPTIDVGLGGTTKVQGGDPDDVEEKRDINATEFGIQAGVLVYF